MLYFYNRIRVSSSLINHLKRRVSLNLTLTRIFTTDEGHRPAMIQKRGVDLLHDPWFNKGTAFSLTERDRLDLRGLLPPNVMSLEQQIKRFKTDLKRFAVHARDGPSDPNALAKWRILNRLHDRNETMFYKTQAKDGSVHESTCKVMKGLYSTQPVYFCTGAVLNMNP